VPLFVVILLLAGQLVIAPAGFAQVDTMPWRDACSTRRAARPAIPSRARVPPAAPLLTRSQPVDREQLRSQLVNPQHRHAAGASPISATCRITRSKP